MQRKLIILMASLAIILCAVPAVAKDQAAPLDTKQCLARPSYTILSAKTGTTLVCRQAYLSDYDTTAKIPAWVTYTLTPAHSDGCVVRSNAFAADQSLPKDKRSDPKDYAKSGYDIGHVAPDGDMSFNEEVEHESFILTNMTPQLPGLNRGIWKLLESDVRAWAYETGHTLAIYDGPVYNVSKDKKIGPDKVDVPTQFFKVVVDTKSGQYLAFLFPQEGDLGTDLTKFQVTLPAVEKASGLTFHLPKTDKPSSALWPVSLKDFAAAKKKACAK